MEDQKKLRVEGISLTDMLKIHGEIYLKEDTFKKLCRLRILIFHMPWRIDKQVPRDINQQVLRGINRQVFRPCGDQLDYLPDKLWYLCWDCFPFKYWPSTFSAKHLIELRLRWSNLECLWSGEMELGKLKVIDLSFSTRLKIFPSLSKVTNIEEIYLHGCEELVEFSSDLHHLRKLTQLRFSCKKLSKLPNLPPNLLRLDISRISAIKFTREMKSINFEGTDTRIIGIYGSIGVGKTTIAKLIFNKWFREFDYSCFLEDVGDKYQEVSEIGLQKEFQNKVFGGFDESVHPHVLIRERLCHKRVLLVLDDVDSLEQFNVLVNSLEVFGRGSKIIITTKDIRVLTTTKVHHVYKLSALDDGESLQLFSRYAFKQNQPPNHFLELSCSFIEHAKGRSLALRLLGGLLYGLEIHKWQGELDKLERLGSSNIYQILKLCYDGLKDDFVKEVFLDIAFFFIGENELKVQEILDRYNGTQRGAIRILKDRGLITDDSDNVLCMPRRMRSIVHQFAIEKSKYPWECSRLHM